MTRIVVPTLALMIFSVAAPLPAAEQADGAAVFKGRCASCHANGGNIIRKDKTLSKKDLEANNIRSEEDILRLIRNPGPAMPKYDQKMLSDEDARAVARYILETFNQ
jgi:cytochrome c6